MKATWQWLVACLPAFRAHGGGSVVAVASQLAFGGGAMNAAYIASKGAIVSLTKTAALELAPDNIRVNAVAPGATDTGSVPCRYGPQSEPGGAGKIPHPARHEAFR